MTVRSRRSTQEGTGVCDPPERRRVLFGTSPAGVATSSPGAVTRVDSWELDATEVPPRPGATVEQATPTRIDTPVPERSEPIRVISMKDQAGAGKPRITGEQPRVPLHVQLRTMAEVAGLHDPPSGLGRLAPPHDPRLARRRRRRDNVVWTCVAIVLAGGISLAIWLIAGR